LEEAAGRTLAGTNDTSGSADDHRRLRRIE
jgi:hypothetical protein